MKLGRIVVDSPDGRETRVVAVEPEHGRVVDLKKAYALSLQKGGATVDGARHLAHATFRDLTQGISAGDFFLEAANQALEVADDAAISIDEVTWTAAIKPPVIRDSLTFNGHIKNFFGNVMKTIPTREVYERPGYFKGTTSTIYGHDEVIPYPSITEMLDYELEIGYIIGKPGRNLTPENAWDHVFGITIFNDWSLRDVQKLESPIGMGAQHSKDFAYGIGPWIVTRDELGSVIGLTGQVRVNGEVWSDTRVEDFIWTPKRPSPTPRSSTESSPETSSVRARWPSAPGSNSASSCSQAMCWNSSWSVSARCGTRSRMRRRPRHGGLRRSRSPSRGNRHDRAQACTTSRHGP